MATTQTTLASASGETLQDVLKELKQHCDRLGIKEGEGWADTLEPVYDELFDYIESGELPKARRRSLDALVTLFYSNREDGQVGLRDLMVILEEKDKLLIALRKNVAKAAAGEARENERTG